MADSILRLKVESQEYDAKLKRAAQGLQQYADGCRKVGGTLEYVEKDTLDFVKAIGKMETVSRTAKGSLGEMTQAFTQFSMIYKQMSAEERNSPIGKALNQSLTQLKGRIQETKKDLQDIDKELNGTSTSSINLKSIVGELGGRFGVSTDALGALTSGTMAYTAAIGAAATAVAYATKVWAEYNSELAKQQQITTVTTGLKGEDADKVTAAGRAISKVYGTDFREVINAANTLMSQFGETGDSAIQIIKDGMQGMIQGDGPKLLSMIQQYAPAFRDAGVSASQLVAVIQNSEGGIFTDQNMNAIVMGIKNIRLMTKATSDALAQLGIDGEEMSRNLSNGSMTIFDALKKVAGAIKDAESGSQEAGQVMQQVFGRQGAMAGTKLGEAIEGLNTNLEEMKTKTGDVGESMKRLTGTTEQFERTLMDVFGVDGWDTMSNDIKTGVLVSLNETLTSLGEIFRMLNGIAGIDMNAMGVAKFFTDLATFAYEALNPVLGVMKALSDLNKMLGGGGNRQNVETLSPEMQKVYDLAAQGGDGTSIGEVVVYGTRSKKTGGSGRGGRGGGSVKTEEQEIAEQIKKLSAEYEKADAERREQLTNEIRLLQQRNAEIKYYQDLAVGKKVRPMGADVMEGQGVRLGTVDNISNELSKPLDVSAIKTPLQSLEEELKNLIELQKLAWSPEQFSAYQSMIENVQEKIGAFKGISKEGKETGKSWKEAASAISSAGSSLQQLEDPSAKIVGIIGQAIANIALGFAQATASDSKLGVFGWIAAIAGGLATMTATIEAIHSATGYAQGGIIKGNSYSGDNIGGFVDGSQFVGLNAGEVVLNASQQRMVAQNLQDSGGGMHVVGEIQGEKIVLVANRFLKRSGQGELVTWK